MVEWQETLQRALHGGDPAEMKAALSAVPAGVLHTAAPYFSQMAEACVRGQRYDEALTYLDQLVAIEPDEIRWRIQRAEVNSKLDELPAVRDDAQRIIDLQPDEATGHRLLAAALDGLRERRAALEAYRRVLERVPDDTHAAQRIEFLQQQLQRDEILQQVLNPPAAAEARAEPPAALPAIAFDPQLLIDPAIPASTSTAMVAGLKQHLQRYGVHHSSRATLERLDDPAWLQTWDAALAGVAGERVLLHGSELGVFAVRALVHGAAHVTVVEPSPIDARIASGIVQKHLIAGWHAQHGADIPQWNEEQRRESFAAFARHVDIVPADAADLQPATYDRLVFANLDHTLLGTGIVRVLRHYRERGAATLRLLGSKARIYAQAVQWAYPGTDLDLSALSALRWSPYPQALDQAADGCTALTAPTLVGTIDLDAFEEARWSCALDVVAAGRLDAIVYWFELDVGAQRLNSGPDGGLRCLRPAVQYTDPIDVAEGSVLPITVRVEASRLQFETLPAAQQPRSGVLPSWYVPMIVDAARNHAYREALRDRLAGRTDATVLDIGAGCGLLSMMAAQLGAAAVYGCEVDGPLARVAERVAAANPCGDKVRIVNRDCRRMTTPEDMPARADLAVFELFDCSLIGEGVLHYLAYAREHLLAPNAIYVPMAGRVRAMVVEYRLERVLDVDVNILNPYRFSPEFINVDARRLDYRPLSAAFDVFAFDFAAAAPTPQEHAIEIAATAAGTAGAVLFWFDLQLAPDRWLSNAPDSAHPLHWKQALQFLPEVQVQPGMALPLSAKHNGSALTFRWPQDALPAEAFSKLPRFDPRVFQQASELQAQTASLFQHCMSDHDEYRRVAELAQRFAVDPAAHGLDPRIAQRFAAKFLANGS